VSRGEAVEIGGGFRIPDVLRQSGAQLVEVGTTNRTYARDFREAIDVRTGALLKVHPSNFAMSGFVHSVSVAELAEIGRETGISVIDDVGSGALIETERFGLAPEPTIGQSLAAGATVVTASGDKLLGGPQAGLIMGTVEVVQRIGRHPLARAVRADKTTLAGIAMTLRHYVRGEAERTIPVWRMIATTEDQLQERALAIMRRLGGAGNRLTYMSCQSTIGGGSLPGATLPSVALAVAHPSVDCLARVLRLGVPAVFGRIEDGRLIIDLRTVPPDRDEALATAIIAGLAEADSDSEAMP
jgi:L-seryl-tRNA(Ser) seleniumtransferase